MAATRRIVEVRQAQEPLAALGERAAAMPSRARMVSGGARTHRPRQRDRRVQAALAVARHAAC